MKKSNSTKKALGAFWKLGAVALITATIFFVACKQTSEGGGGEKPTPTPTPKHAIAFSVDSTTPNGTLKAKADGMAETDKSPINVEEGKTVTFTAEPSANYKVKEWKVGDIVVTGNKTNTYTHTVKKAVTVKVSFEAKSNPPTPQTKYTVTLNQTEHGKVTASPEIPTDKQMAKDTVITFTAEANAGYKIGKWTVTGSVLEAGTGADGSPTAKVKITADTTVSVSFESNGTTPNPPTPQGTAILTLSPDKLTIEVRAKTADGSAITVEGCKETTLASDTKTTLTATGKRVVLKGKITMLFCHNNQLTALNVQGLTSLQVLWCEYNKLTELNVQGLTELQELDCGWNKLSSLNVQGCTELRWFSCSNNQLTALNVQGRTALKYLWCYSNQLNAQAMTELLNALPTRNASDEAFAVLYTMKTGVTEGNCKDYTQPAELKAAFDGAKSRNWKLKNERGGCSEDI